jgi:hypothetical protein
MLPLLWQPLPYRLTDLAHGVIPANEPARAAPCDRFSVGHPSRLNYQRHHEWDIESCFRRMKQTGLEVRPMFHWTPRRIEAHVKLCVLALQMQRTAEIRCGQPWARIAHTLARLKAVRYRSDSRTIVQRTKSTAALAETLKKLGISMPKQILSIAEPAQAADAA